MSLLSDSGDFSPPLQFMPDTVERMRNLRTREKTGMRLLARGIHGRPDITEDDVLAQALSVLAYQFRDREVRLIGASAWAAISGFSPAMAVPDGKAGHYRIFAAVHRDSTRNRRLTAMLDLPDMPLRLDVVMFREQSILKRDYPAAKSRVVQVHPDISVPVRFSTRTDMFMDAMLYPESFPDRAVLQRIAHALTDEEMDFLLDHAETRGLVMQARDIHAKKEIPLAVNRSMDVWLEDRLAGRITRDSLRWRFQGVHPDVDGGFPDVPENVIPEDAGGFLSALLPEGVAPQEDTELDTFLQGKPRRMMGLTLVPSGSLAPDVVARSGIIAVENDITTYAGPEGIIHPADVRAISLVEHLDVDRLLRCMYEDATMPRLSGAQAKMPGTIRMDEETRTPVLCVVGDGAKDLPFTLLIKPDPQDMVPNIRGIPVLEWAGQQAAKAAGLEVPDHALWLSPDGKTSALLSQRFDMQKEGEWMRGRTYRIGKDGLAVTGNASENKYQIGLRSIWKGFSKYGLDDLDGGASQAAASQAAAFLHRVIAAWAMGDDDLHGKNLSILQEIVIPSDRDSAVPKSWSVKMSPAYDTVPVRALPHFSRGNMALPVEGRRDNISLQHWISLGRFLGVAQEKTEHLLAKTAVSVANRMAELADRKHPIHGMLDADYGKRIGTLLDNAAEVSGRNLKSLKLTARDEQVLLANN